MENEFIYEKYIYEDQCHAIEQRVDWSKIKSVLEIGFGAGHSARYFLSHPDVSVTSFEMNKRDYTIREKQAIDEKYPGRHEMVWGDSTFTLPRIPTRKFDLIFIDGGHELERSRSDIVNCMRFARPDTIVIAPDVSYEHEWSVKYTLGVTRAWREFVNISVIQETFHGCGICIGKYLIFHEYSVSKPKVVDAFMFYNELEMLKYRLTVMGPYVDRFVICECPVSHAGKPKPLYFQENKHLFEPWLDKITHLVWKDGFRYVSEKKDSWYNENTQRNHLLEGLRDLKPNDIVIISDIDEIISPTILERIDDILVGNPIVALSMDLYYYDIEHVLPGPWEFARAVRYDFVRDVKPHNCRNSSRKDPVIQDAGWHLSFFGDDRFIVNKTKNYAHIEAAEFFSSVTVQDVKKLGIAVSSSAERRLVFVPKEQNPRLPPRLDILPHQVI
jgi:beta-1,4-mannosyl-glycoprotein beta-1,4-N-acetylglucosaminyltransferase